MLVVGHIARVRGFVAGEVPEALSVVASLLVAVHTEKERGAVLHMVMVVAAAEAGLVRRVQRALQEQERV